MQAWPFLYGRRPALGFQIKTKDARAKDARKKRVGHLDMNREKNRRNHYEVQCTLESAGLR